jgi:hypothetical protein
MVCCCFVLPTVSIETDQSYFSAALTETASSLYFPLLERRKQAEKIRVTLSVLEQWKFFFNLPSSLSDLIAKGKYDAAVRDYKKGKYLMSTSFASGSNSNNNNNNSSNTTNATNTPVAGTAPWNTPAGANSTGSSLAGTPLHQTPTTSKEAIPSEIPKPAATSDQSQPTDSLLPEHYRKVFDEVWNEVEKIVGKFRDQLFEKLEDPSASLDSQERVMSLVSIVMNASQ